MVLPAASALPISLVAPRISARACLVIAAGVGCAVCAYAGLYPRFDSGALRIVLALTSAPFGAAVMLGALKARTAARAFGMTLVFAVLLGVASALLPLAILVNRHSDEQLIVGCLFGCFFGAPTGLLYGIPLAILAACGHRHVQTATHEATDRAACISGSWLFFIGLIALLGTQGLDGATSSAALPSVVACAAALGGVVTLARAAGRERRRSTWLWRVREGLEPTFRVRPADSRDGVDALPRLGDGATVVEWCPQDGSGPSAYRSPASGVAIAVVDDRPV
jgi:hypothetical protein